MVKREVLRRKLEALEEYLKILRKIKRYSFAEFVSEPERYGSAERFLQLSIEVLDDIGNHIIADDELGEVSTYSDIPRILLKNKYITKSLSEEWIRMVGFRNILVHGYKKIDRKIVYEILTAKLKDLDKIARKFSTLL